MGHKTVLVTEPIPILTIHSHRVAFLELVGGDFHFALCLEQPITGIPHGIESIINNRVSIPMIGVADALPLVFRKLPDVMAHRALATMMATWRGQKLMG